MITTKAPRVLFAAVFAAILAAAVQAADSGPAIKGIEVVGTPSDVQATGTPAVQGIQVKNLPFLDRGDFKHVMATYLGRANDDATRAAVRTAVVKFYRDQGHLMVDVSVPPQEITGGVLQVLVVEGTIEKVELKGNKWFGSSTVMNQIHAKPGQEVNSVQLGNDLDWINRNPFRQVDLVYVKGSELGKTDLELRETDTFPVRGYAGYEDSGTTLTGYNRLLGGLNWGNVFGGDGQFNYQYMADPSFKWFRANSASFIQPLPWRHILTIFGSYAVTDGKVSNPFSLNGYNWQGSARYEIPFSRESFWSASYTHALELGFDFKRASNNLAFGGTQVFGGLTDNIQWSAGYNAAMKDRWGSTTMRGTYVFSPGGLSNNDDSAHYNNARAGARPHYQYGHLELNRTTGLWYDFVLANQLTAQVSDGNLLSSEQLGFGGYDTIRGYDQRIVNADEGFIVSNELRTPPMSIMRYFKGHDGEDNLQFLAFFDYGQATNHFRLPNEPYKTDLASVGPGVRYAISPWLSFRLDWGHQLHQVIGSTNSARTHMGAVISF